MLDANAADIKAITNGIPNMRRVFFLPNKSAEKPAANGPMVAPSGSKEPIHADWDVVEGEDNGVVVLLSRRGSSGDVQPNHIPAVNADKLAGI